MPGTKPVHALIVASTVKEIEPFLSMLRENPSHFSETDVLITGVGMVATAWALTHQIGIKRPGIIIQAGIAGCFDRSVDLGTVFVVKRDTIAEMGVMEKKNYKTIFDLKLASPDDFPYKKGWMINDFSLISITGMKKVDAVTINEISTSKSRINLYQKKFKPVIETMEGAALHYVCLKEKIPFLQIRAVSNYIGERNKKNWLLKQSIDNLNHQLTRLLYKL
jgi:futalosine hydrolase